MNTQEELQQKFCRAAQKRDYAGMAKYSAELEKLKKEEHIACRDLFSEMTPKQINAAKKECRKIPVFADLLAQSAIELTNILKKVDKSCNLVLMQDVDKCRYYAERIVKIVDDLKDDEFSESFGHLADLAAAAVDNVFELQQPKK